MQSLPSGYEFVPLTLAHVLNEIDCAFNRFHQHESIRLLPSEPITGKYRMMSGITLTDSFSGWYRTARRRPYQCPCIQNFLLIQQ